MNNSILIDNINIKTLPELIINFLKEKNINSKLNSVRNIYSLILNEISVDIKDSYLNKIQKYLSSSESTNILIFDDINDNIYDKELSNSCKLITESINKSNDNIQFYKELVSKCNFIHFEEDELNNIKVTFENKNYNDLVFYLFKHAFKKYKTNTPKILAQRLFNDAMTLSKGLPIRKNLFKISADLGNSLSAFQYSNSITNNNERLIYFLKGKELDICLWHIGYIIEYYKISNSQLDLIKKELKDILAFYESNDTFNCIFTPNAKNDFEQNCIMTAFKIYLYLAEKKNFSKAYNSIGKFLIYKRIAFLDKNNNIDMEKTDNTGIVYLKKAISLSNIPAMQNLAIYYKNHNYNLDMIKPLVLASAENEDLISCVELSKLLMNEGKFDEAINYLEYAAMQKSSYAQHNLAKIYENKFDYDTAKYWYKEALKNGSKSSAINLAQIYFKEYVDDKTPMKNSYLIYAISILKNHQNNLDEEHKEIAIKLLNEWNNMIN